MTRSGVAATISSVSAVQESWRTFRLRVARHGRASMQYLVQAQRWSSLSSASRVTVMDGWSEAMRIVASLAETDHASHDTHPSQKNAKEWDTDTNGRLFNLLLGFVTVASDHGVLERFVLLVLHLQRVAFVVYQ